MSTRFLCRIDSEGRLVPSSAPERFKRLSGREKWVSIHDQPTLALRSDQANKYLWGVVYREICLATGNDPHSVHYGLKRKALEVGILEPEYILLGDNLVEDDPTTRTDPDTFARYVDWIRHEAEHGTLLGSRERPVPLHIPEPGE